MKQSSLGVLILSLAIHAHAFVIPLTFDEKCRDADAILHIVVEKVERVSLTSGMKWQFQALARCKVMGSFIGDQKWEAEYVFIPCGYGFDESLCDIQEKHEYVVFLETLGNFSKFAHPLRALCCHPVSDGKVDLLEGDETPISLEELANKIAVSFAFSKHEEGRTNPSSQSVFEWKDIETVKVLIGTRVSNDIQWAPELTLMAVLRDALRFEVAMTTIRDVRLFRGTKWAQIGLRKLGSGNVPDIRLLPGDRVLIPD